MKLFAMLDVLIHIFHDIFGEGRSEKAAMAESALAELRAALAPGDDFAAIEMFADFFLNLVVAGHVAIDNLAVVENGLDFLRSRFGSKGERGERSAAGVACEFFAGEESSAEGSARVASDGLDVNIFEATAELQSANEEDVQENTAGEAKIVSGGFAAEIAGESDDEFFEEI